MVQRTIWGYLGICLLVVSIMIGGCTGMQQGKQTDTVAKFPEKPITFIVPASVGGSMDITGRLLEKVAVRHLGQPLLIVNKPGGAATVGWNELAAAPPDGYTVGMVGPDIFLQTLYGASKYNYLTALEPVAQIASSPQLIVSSATAPWSTIEELLQYAKAHPGQVKFGHWGVGSHGHVTGEMFAQKAGVTLSQVPFRGGGEAVIALLGGHVQLIVSGTAAVKEHVKAGTVRVLGVASEHRLNDPLFKDAPTLKELGLNLVVKYWLAVGAPKEMPSEIKAKLAQKFKAIITDPEVQKSLEGMGLIVDYLDPEAAKAYWLEENKIYTRTIQETGILDLIKAQKK